MWYRFLQTLGQVTFVLFFGYRFYGVRNVPRSGPVILASNHQSFLDPMAVGMPLERRFASLARESLFRNRAFGWLLRNLGSVPLDQESADVGAMRQSLRLLKGGGLLLLFPEGTRTRDGSIGEMQAGLAVLAARGGAAVVPTVVEGAFKCWPRSRKVPRLGKVCVAYGRPMRYKGHGSEGAREFVRALRERMVKLQAGLRDGSVQAGRQDL